MQTNPFWIYYIFPRYYKTWKVRRKPWNGTMPILMNHGKNLCL